MENYTVFVHPSGATENVKQGWSWPAFFFTWIWAFLKKLWIAGILLLFLTLALIFSQTFLGVILGLSEVGTDNAVFAIVGLFFKIFVFIFHCICGMAGNSWRRKSLVSRGYKATETFGSASSKGAWATMNEPDDSQGEAKEKPV